MMTMTTTHTPTADETTRDGAVLFSNPETAEPVVVPGLDPAAAAAVFSSPY
jgi:hypothetical protein